MLPMSCQLCRISGLEKLFYKTNLCRHSSRTYCVSNRSLANKWLPLIHTTVLNSRAEALPSLPVSPLAKSQALEGLVSQPDQSYSQRRQRRLAMRTGISRP